MSWRWIQVGLGMGRTGSRMGMGMAWGAGRALADGPHCQLGVFLPHNAGLGAMGVCWCPLCSGPTEL